MYEDVGMHHAKNYKKHFHKMYEDVGMHHAKNHRK